MLTTRKAAREAEQGFVLVGLLVAIFIILLFLGVAAPRVAKGLRREREVEAVHRGDQYVRAVQVYYRKVGHYPGSIEQLEKTNGVRYLRQRYADPMTGKPDWRLIHVGEAKTTVKGFFGQALGGLPGGALGNSMGAGGSVGAGAAGVSGAAGTAGAAGSSFGSSSFGASGGSSSSGSSFGASSFGASSTGSTGATTGVGTGTTATGSSGPASQSASSMNGTGAPIMGVGSAATGNSIVVLNEQTTYPTWEFIYDPRIEQLKAKASLMGGSMSSTSVSNMGGGSTTPGGSTMPGSSTTPGTSGAGASGAGSSGFGGSSFGSSSFGSGGTNGSSSQPQTTP